jgi:hypothetical protein
MRLYTAVAPAALALFGFGLHASPITGTFNIAGTVTATATTINWQLTETPFTSQKAIIGPSGTGSFATPGIAGTTIGIQNLDRAVEPVGANFAAIPFITFDSPVAAAGGFPSLLINFIEPGIYSNTACATLPPTVGQTCTPSQPGLPSPFNMVNNPPNATPQATVTFVFSGVTSDGLETWAGNFTSSFRVPYQDVLASFAANGSVTQTFAGTISLRPQGTPIVPEAGTLSMLGLSLIAIAVRLRGRSR